ncbi:MAG: hypothetical protein C6Y22_08355 [Hapalosiphonaceae cyanobacterium JJU2]|nr:MAG: hypothetical protein C6Y22_08355 [Hapalosiphonaceae cyanobacterium JJU2]
MIGDICFISAVREGDWIATWIRFIKIIKFVLKFSNFDYEGITKDQKNFLGRGTSILGWKYKHL